MDTLCFYAVLSAVIPTVAPFSSRLGPPQECRSMVHHEYAAHRHKNLAKERITDMNGDFLYCRDDCCGTLGNTKCCMEEESGGMSILKLASIIAAGVVGLAILILFGLHFLKAHNKKRQLIADIQALQASKKNKGNKKNKNKNKNVKTIKVGQYQRAPEAGLVVPNQWNSPKGNIFITKPAIPDIVPAAHTSRAATDSSPSSSFPAETRPAPSLYDSPARRSPTGFTALHQTPAIPAAGSDSFPGQAAPRANQYNPDQEVLRSIIATLPGPKLMPSYNNAGHGGYRY